MDRVQRQELRDELLELITLYEQGSTFTINLSDLNLIAWDKLYVFPPYSSGSTIDLALGTIWFDSRLTSIEFDEGITLLVFTHKGEVVQHLEFPRFLGDFSMAGNRVGYNKIDAKFVMDKRKNILWVNNEN